MPSESQSRPRLDAAAVAPNSRGNIDKNNQLCIVRETTSVVADADATSNQGPTETRPPEKFPESSSEPARDPDDLPILASPTGVVGDIAANVEAARIEDSERLPQVKPVNRSQNLEKSRTNIACLRPQSCQVQQCRRQPSLFQGCLAFASLTVHTYTFPLHTDTFSVHTYVFPTLDFVTAQIDGGKEGSKKRWAGRPRRTREAVEAQHQQPTAPGNNLSPSLPSNPASTTASKRRHWLRYLLFRRDPAEKS